MDGEEEVIDNLIAWFPSGPHIQNISWREFDETPEGKADHLVTLDMSNVRKFTAVAEKKDLQPEAPQAAWGFSVSPNDVGPDDDVTEIL